MCRVQWPLTLAFTFKVIQPLFCNKIARICLTLLCPRHSIYSSAWVVFHIWHKWSIGWEGVSHAMTFELNLYLQGNSAMSLWYNCQNTAYLAMSALQHVYVWMKYFHIWYEWIRECVACNDFDLHLYLRGDLAMAAITHLKCGTFYCIHFTASIVLN